MVFAKGTTALVTGASGGIGRAIALKLAEKGADVIIHYGNNKEGARETLRQIREKGGNGVTVRADVSDVKQTDEMFQFVLGAVCIK